MTERELLEKFRLTPEGQKLLQTIRYAEGTAGPEGYRTIFGGGKFSDFSRHPDTVVNKGGYSSAAAGAYQFLPGTYRSAASRLGLQGFTPKEQDIAALSLARNRLMKLGGLASLSKEGLSSRVAAALAPEWASFPTEAGVSYYGQPSKPLAALQKVYGQTPVGLPAESAVDVAAEPVSPVSLPRYDFKGALANIVKDFTAKQLQTSGAPDLAEQYQTLAGILGEEGTQEAEDLAEQYAEKAIAASMQTSGSTLDPTELVQKLAKAKLDEQLYNQQAASLEQQINTQIGATASPTAAGPLTPGKGIALGGVTITDPVDISGFDFAIQGGRGAAFKVPFKAKVLKVVGNQNWETNLEKGQKGPRGYGNYVDVRGVDPDTGRQFDVRLAHFDKVNASLRPGMVIDPGTFIGTQGRTGSTTGPHVSADFYDPDKNTASQEILAIRNKIRDRLAKGLPVF